MKKKKKKIVIIYNEFEMLNYIKITFRLLTLFWGTDFEIGLWVLGNKDSNWEIDLVFEVILLFSFFFIVFLKIGILLLIEGLLLSGIGFSVTF